jgi:acyl-CoA dehydrogenase
MILFRPFQAFGGAGVSSDFPLAHFWAMSRILRVADGPDEVHRRAVARMEIKRHDMKG